MKKTNRYIIAAVFSLVLIFTISLYAQDTTDEQFALQLVKALGLENKLPANPTTADYFKILTERGYAPDGGYKEGNIISKKDMAVLLNKAFGLDKQAALGEDEKYRDKAVITDLSGDVQIKMADKDWALGAKNIVLTQNDTIKTGKDSWAELRIGVVGRLKVKENTLLHLNALGTKSDGLNENIIMYMETGELLVDVRGLKEDSTFKTITPTTVAAVRGTIYTVTVKPDEGKTQVKQ